MPNWCMNVLEVRGEENKVKEFAEKFEKDGISAFYPTPKELEDVTAPAKTHEPKKAEENIKKYGYADWYDWRVANWGTKWDVCELYLLSRKEGEATFRFDTAWAPPGRAFEKIASMYPELRFELEFEEPGMGFFGRIVYEDGEVVAIDEYEWEDRYEDGWWLYKNMIDLDEEFDALISELESFYELDEETAKEILNLWEKADEEMKLKIMRILESYDVEFIKEEIEELREAK